MKAESEARRAVLPAVIADWLCSVQRLEDVIRWGIVEEHANWCLTVWATAGLLEIKERERGARGEFEAAQRRGALRLVAQGERLARSHTSRLMHHARRVLARREEVARLVLGESQGRSALARAAEAWPLAMVEHEARVRLQLQGRYALWVSSVALGSATLRLSASEDEARARIAHAEMVGRWQLLEAAHRHNALAVPYAQWRRSAVAAAGALQVRHTERRARAALRDTEHSAWHYLLHPALAAEHEAVRLRCDGVEVLARRNLVAHEAAVWRQLTYAILTGLALLTGREMVAAEAAARAALAPPATDPDLALPSPCPSPDTGLTVSRPPSAATLPPRPHSAPFLSADSSIEPWGSRTVSTVAPSAATAQLLPLCRGAPRSRTRHARSAKAKPGRRARPASPLPPQRAPRAQRQQTAALVLPRQRTTQTADSVEQNAKQEAIVRKGVCGLPLMPSTWLALRAVRPAVRPEAVAADVFDMGQPDRITAGTPFADAWAQDLNNALFRIQAMHAQLAEYDTAGAVPPLARPGRRKSRHALHVLAAQGTAGWPSGIG